MPVPCLSSGARRRLLAVAREAVSARIGARSLGSPLQWSVAGSGAFVTLHVEGDLRGCVGRMTVDGSLAEAVRQVAAAAAGDDPRFAPLSYRDLGGLLIEVSILGPLQPCPGPDQLEIGRHGVVVDAGARHGVLLPQVAVEHHWTSPEFVVQVCRKAGLRPDAWRHGARLFTFEAEVFREEYEARPDSRDL